MESGYGSPLRRPAILPLTNIYTIAGALVLGYLALTVGVGLLWKEHSGIEYVFLLMLLQSIPVMIAFTRRHFTFLAFIMIYHLVQLSIPKYFTFLENPLLRITSPQTVQAVQEQFYCTGIIILVYYACRSFLFANVAEKERFQYLTLSRFQVFVLAGYVIFVPLFISYLPAWFLSIHFMLLSSDLVLLFCANSPGNQQMIRITKMSAVIGALVYFLDTGMMTLMVAIMSLAFLISSLQKRYALVFFLSLLIIPMSAVQSVKGPFRAIIDPYTTGMEFTKLEKLELLWELIAEKYFGEEETPALVVAAAMAEDEDDEPRTKFETVSHDLLGGFMRVGDDSLERVLAYTPSKVPFWNGETYAGIPFMFIPRALWPGKPTRHFWNKFGRLYEVLSPDDITTSVGVSYLAESYMNFGYGGMYSCAIFVGFLFAFVERSAFVILGGYFYFPFIVLITPLLSPGSDMGSMLNSLWLLYMFFLVGRPVLMRMAQRDDYS